MTDARGFSRVDLLLTVAILLVLTALSIVGLDLTARASREQGAVDSLRLIGAAEEEFRSNDRDGNGIADYWTGDVAGLHRMTSASTPGNEDPPLALIEGTLAAADCDPLSEKAAKGEYRSSPNASEPASKSGYWFYALRRKPDGGMPRLQTNTGGTPDMGRVHHPDRFGILAFPHTFGEDGTAAFITGEEGTVLRKTLAGPIRSRSAVPPGPPPAEFLDWPAAADLKRGWTKAD